MSLDKKIGSVYTIRVSLEKNGFSLDNWSEFIQNLG